jgi:hypothetical protein
MMSMRSLSSAVLVLALAGVQSAAAQTPRAYTLNVKSDGRFTSVSLVADDVKVSDLTADLGRRLHARVVLGPSVQNATVSVNLVDVTLEQALLSLASRVFVDYEFRQDTAPAPLGIYLLGANDPPPASDAVVKGLSQGILIEGNTEDVPKAPEEDPLKVTADRGVLSVYSKKQPLALVARAIGDVLGIPVEMKYDATELIDANLTNGRPEETVTGLSPNARIYVRVDVNLGERRPLKLVIERAPAK